MGMTLAPELGALVQLHSFVLKEMRNEPIDWNSIISSISSRIGLKDTRLWKVLDLTRVFAELRAGLEAAFASKTAGPGGRLVKHGLIFSKFSRNIRILLLCVKNWSSFLRESRMPFREKNFPIFFFPFFKNSNRIFSFLKSHVSDSFWKANSILFQSRSNSAILPTKME
ncbi:hypothetical protein LEP1GSC168_0848 [Leptospira santarosai str. HAI134]|nr:hypothetical protein LEP1GSC168_0848 [Leptospira santarosai str. HAI134]